jgi:hypothetical protein
MLSGRWQMTHKSAPLSLRNRRLDNAHTGNRQVDAQVTIYIHKTYHINFTRGSVWRATEVWAMNCVKWWVTSHEP